ncbi:MAG TPA: hypothetical protein VD862_04565 [Candidatus Paceibacterota bacterium]|nr:hypothetical protein [Candidatus Paceibacterota bacterium]
MSESNREPAIRREMGGHEDYGAYERKVRQEMWEQYKDMLRELPTHDDREEAVRKLAKQEMARRASAKVKAESREPEPAGKKTEQGPAPAASVEKPLGILDAGPWLKWDDVVYAEGKFHVFTSEFVPALVEALGELSSDMQVRTRQMNMIRNLYQGKLFRMYANQYPDRPADELRENVQGWLDERWEQTLAAARRLAS